MKESKADLMLHPVRFRIIQCLLGGRHMTTQEIHEELGDVPQATLYRHLNKLLKSGLLTIAEQRPVRGTLEKVYAMPDTRPDVSAGDLKRMTRDDHMRSFMMFVASMIDDYDRYLQHDHFDLIQDGVSYRQATTYLSDEEFTQLIHTLRSSVEQTMTNPRGPGRRRRTISTVIIPEPNNEG